MYGMRVEIHRNRSGENVVHHNVSEITYGTNIWIPCITLTSKIHDISALVHTGDIGFMSITQETELFKDFLCLV